MSASAVFDAPPVNPSRFSRVNVRWIVSATAATIAGAWAFWPLASPALPTIPEISKAPLPFEKPRRLDLAAFRAPLWVAPPPPPAPPAPLPPPPPLKLQLIGIVSENGVQAALLFDPDQNRLLTVHQGESIGDKTVERVTGADVSIRDRAGSRTLALRPDRPAPGRPEEGEP